ncbi:hypothetical protein I6A84_18495 [Frankia sp. CNm7]|uniref:hypothetical protein n=1 Tax=Frankia nepalensis TaxID=1836974 RepID=UPI001932335B|nr:hypothetical protein [Frankia nepalensis]MBL7520027.1 hypothetical protein [Frankia nepalensis]
MTNSSTTPRAARPTRRAGGKNTQAAVVVPVSVAALAVNARTRDTDGTFVFQRWRTNFRFTELDNLPPEPRPFDVESDWRGNPDRLGVYLQWQLPEALCRGKHESTGGVGDFPLVPNRWLVVRYGRSSRAVRAWLVHSDYLDPRDGTVSFADPTADGVVATMIGRRHELTADAPWREPADPPEPFLTAVGPGLMTFTVFQPYNENVFSIHDTLDDVTGADRLSYAVAGWYATAGSDILADGELTDLLEKLEWTVPGPAAAVGRRTLYTGTALGVDWDPDGAVPDSDSPDGSTVAVAIGNSAAEAAAELQEQADGPDAFSADDAALFRAFLLGALDDLDRGDGEEIVERTAHQGGFGPVPGGYRWQVVGRGDPSTPSSLSSAALARRQRAEDTVVADLNRAQRAHDRLEHDLTAARERLYQLWWLSRLSKQPDEFRSKIGAQLDPANPDGTAGQVAALTAALATARRTLPWGLEHAELAASIAAYATDHGIVGDRRLTRVPRDPFEQHADPAVVLAGARLNAPLIRGDALPCRLPDRHVTRVAGGRTTIGAADVAADLAKVALGGLPAELLDAIRGALTEFLILDRALAAGMDLATATVTGTLPELGAAPWRQPWQPLYMMWEAEFYPLTFRDGATEHWKWDSNRYRWLGVGAPAKSRVVRGRQYLTPSVGHATAGRFDTYARHRDDPAATVARALRADAEQSDLLVQRLDGLGAAVGQREPAATAHPTGAIADLLADGDYRAPDPGPQPLDEWDEWEPSQFVELRAGQMKFTRLSVVDRFGRAVNLITNDYHFTPVVPDTMVPDHPVHPVEPDRFIELSPRLLQPARLRFDLLPATHTGNVGDDVDLAPGENPVAGWLLHNRLDASLACYDPDGAALGELRVVMAPSGDRIVDWTPLPGSPLTDFGELAGPYPHLYRFLRTIKERGVDTFTAVRQTIDEALTTIDPDGPDDTALSFLAGRPLALVRARVDLELCGPIRRDVHWRAVLSPPTPQMPTYPWTIRLGEAPMTDDGLVGYVLNDDYDHFETVVDPRGPAGDYLRPIGDGSRLRLSFAGEDNAILTLLFDPRAAVHAVTDILPVGQLRVPERFVTAALTRMAICFRTGPLLAAPRQIETPDGQLVDAMAIPRPATAVGTWSWTEPFDGQWARWPMVAPTDDEAPVGAPEIRSGFLVLDDAASATRHSATR